MRVYVNNACYSRTKCKIYINLVLTIICKYHLTNQKSAIVYVELYLMLMYAVHHILLAIASDPLLTNKDVALIMRRRFYSSCVRNSMLHGSETWSVRKENVVALQRAEMRMVRWMCGVKVKDRFPSKELREIRNRRHGIGITAKQAAVVWVYVAKRR